MLLFFGYDVLMDLIRKHFELIDSTNTWAKQNAHLLEHDKITLVTADAQTAGRGRFKRQWVSPPKQNVYATFCFFIEKHRSDIGNLPQVLAIAVAEMLHELGFTPKLKWPNDVLLSKKKVAGILCETTTLSDMCCVALGIGININMPKAVLEQIDRPATSLMAEDGLERAVEEMVGLLQRHFLPCYDRFIEEGFHPFLEEYNRWLVHKKGDLIRFDDNRTIWNGAFEKINHDGSLTLLMDDGTPKKFVAGEIVWEQD